MVSGARWLFLAMILAYLAAVLFQVFLAGMGLTETHVGCIHHTALKTLKKRMTETEKRRAS